jgi:hypothetical protein
VVSREDARLCSPRASPAMTLKLLGLAIEVDPAPADDA